MPTNPKTKEKVSWREFFKQWKQGMEKVTPLQQCSIIFYGQIITAIGVIWGILFSIKLKYYWMIVVLFGGLVVLSAQFLGNYQKKQILKRMEDTYKLAELEVTNV